MLIDSMNFYDKLQLDPYVLKQMIHKSSSSKERKDLIFIMFLRSVLLVVFAIVFISVINIIFGNENSYLAVVLFCMLLSLRFVHFGYKITHSIISIGIILLILFLIPFIVQIDSLLLRFGLNLVFLSIILLLTGSNPKMGNPGLYSFSYVFLTGTSIHLNLAQIKMRADLLIIFFILFTIMFILKHENKNLTQSLHSVLTQQGFFSKQNIWMIYYALGVTIIIQLGYLVSIKRYMWIGIAFSSLISIYELPSIRQRFTDRLVGILIGTISFYILVQIFPANVLSIVGGIFLGLCTNYRFKNIYNCFGALALATTLFGSMQASLLRVSNNILGLILGAFYLFLGRVIYRKLSKIKRSELGK